MTTIRTPPIATLNGRPSEILEALALWHLFRGLGFAAAVIDTGVLHGHVVVQVSVQGQVPHVRAGLTQMTNEAFQAEWQELARVIAEIPDHELDALWERSVARVKMSEICMSLAAIGVYWPEHPKYRQEVM